MVINSFVIIEFSKVFKKVLKSFKVRVRADAETKHVSKFEVDTGKKDDGPQKALGQNVVKKLTKRIYYNNYCHIYFDNYIYLVST